MQSSADCDFSQNVSFETFHVAKKDQDSCNSELKVNNLLNSHKNTILAINCQNLVHNLEHLRLAMKSLKVKLLCVSEIWQASAEYSKIENYKIPTFKNRKSGMGAQ